MSIFESPYLFVFGTLKTGFPNFKFNHAERIQGEFHILQSYPLYLVGERHSPWLIDSPGEGSSVKGEVYLINQENLALMDKLERIDKDDGYKRALIDVTNIKISNSVSVWTYLKPPLLLNEKFIKSGPFDEYTLDHAKLYRSRPQ